MGYTYYLPKHSDVEACVNDALQLDQGFSTLLPEVEVTCSNNGTCKTSASLSVFGAVSPSSSYRLLPSKVDCSSDTAVLFIRSSASRNAKGSNLDTVSNISEDDCLFSCLTNKAADSHPVQCASAEYDDSKERCTLSSNPRSNELSPHTSTTFYEKICVSQSVSEQCSGAAVDRLANTVLVGYLRDTATTTGIEKCIERCVQSETALGFQCLSIMYYYDVGFL
ncbi:unnamed protein product [Heligmosomoides polygyrus]|uniref:Apple domain-containing protein n=1 Tax=Heligmosomoides polygyrus TaxID=6339 RepID=A0A3P7X235_HELPZ|nr:unnamed protein product [Heligmosomoides polygyrus]